MRPTLSVILPHRNHGSLVEGAVEAYMAQSVPPLEVIITDDASDDGSFEVLERLARRHPRIRLERNARNLGVVLTLNRMLESARGDYVYSAAADDRVLPGLFEKSMSLLARHPEAGLCSSLARHLGPNGEDMGPYETPRVSDVPCYFTPEEVRRTFVRRGFWIVAYTVVFRRGAILEIGGFDPSLGPSCDGFAFQLLALKHGACFVPERLAQWRQPTVMSYARSYTSDLDRAVGLVEEAERQMRTRWRDLHPPDFLEAWKRRAALGQIEGLSREDPVPADRIAGMQRLLPSTGWLDGAYFRALRWLPGLARPLTKLYLLSQRDATEQRRLVGRKLRSLWPGSRDQHIC